MRKGMREKQGEQKKNWKTESKNQQISISAPRTENIWALTGFSCVQVLCSPNLGSIYFAKARFCNPLSTNSLFQGPLDQDPILVGLKPQIETLQLAPSVGRICASASTTVRNGRIRSATNETHRLPTVGQLP